MCGLLKRFSHAFAVLALTVAFAATGEAANFTFDGSFVRDDDVRLFEIAIAGGGPSVVTFSTSSYAAGGFDPVLSLFDAGGSLIDANDDGPTPDSFLQRILGPGRYTLSLTQYDNYAAGPLLTNGFLRSGDPTFTREFGAPGATGPFIDANGRQRNGNFSLTLANVGSAAAIPEPATLMLLGTGLIGAGAIGRRKKRRQ